MGFFNSLLAPRAAVAPVAEFRILVFGPAVLRMSAAGEDPGGALAALVAAVEKLQFPPGFSTERVHAVASELTRMIRIDGVAGIVDRIGSELSPGDRTDALRLALVAAHQGPAPDAAELDRLAGLARQIGIDRAAFEALAEAARRLG